MSLNAQIVFLDRTDELELYSGCQKNVPFHTKGGSGIFSKRHISLKLPR